MVLIFQSFLYVAVPGPELKAACQFGILLIEFCSFLQVLLIDFLLQVTMQFALLHDFLVDLSLGLGAIVGLRLFFLFKTCEVEVLMHVLKLLIFNIRVKVHIIEFLEFIDLLSLMRESVRCLLIFFQQCEFGSSFGNLEHLIALLRLHETLLGIAYSLDFLALCVNNLIGVFVERRDHGTAVPLGCLHELGVLCLLSHAIVDIIQVDNK